jgi:hypothetical protein
VPPREYFFSYHLNFEQSDSALTPETLPKRWKELITLRLHDDGIEGLNPGEKIDAGIYNVKKFIKLAAKCNPNIIELLFVNKSDLLYIDQYGKLLRDNAKLFLSARAKYSFSGYAISQLKRINTHRKWLLDPPKKKPERADYGLPEASLISADQRQAAEALITKQVRIWMLEESEVDKTIIAIIQEDLRVLVAKLINHPLDLDAADRAIEHVAAKEVGIGENYLDILQREKKYRQALNHYNQYQDWLKNRNPVRAELERKFQYDTKHASNLVRLALEAKDILFTGDLIVKNPERAKLLLEVKRGAWNYDQLMEWTESQMKELDTAYDQQLYKVPNKPDVIAIDNVCREICERTLNYYELRSHSQKKQRAKIFS